MTNKTLAFVAVRVRPYNTVNLKRALPEVEEVEEVFYVTGEYDFILKVAASNTFELARILEKIRALEGVERTVTFIVLERLKGPEEGEKEGKEEEEKEQDV